MAFFSGRACGVALAAGVMGMSGVASAAIQNVVQNTAFQTTNQSMWQPGPQTGLTGSQFLGTTWGQKTFSFDYGIPGNDAFGVVQLQPGKIGLQVDSSLTTGNVSVNYPVQLSYSLPDKVQPGQSFQVQTSWAKNPNPLLTTTGLQASASLSLVLNLAATAGAGYDGPVGAASYTASQAGDPRSFSAPVSSSLINAHAQDVSLVNTNGDVKIPIVSVGPSGASFSVSGGPFSVTATVPQLNVSGNTYTGNSITATGNSTPPFISANLDLVSSAVYGANALGIPIPQLSGNVDIGIGKINWTGLSSTVQVGPSLYQGFDFSPTKFPIHLVTSTGQVLDGKVGDTFTVTAPDDPNSTLGIDATTDINNLFTNNTGIVFAANLNTQALSGSMEVGGYNLFNFGPLIEDNTSLYTSSPWLFPGSPESFALGGFNSAQQALSVEIVPEPSTGLLAAAGVMGVICGKGKRRRGVR